MESVFLHNSEPQAAMAKLSGGFPWDFILSHLRGHGATLNASNPPLMMWFATIGFWVSSSDLGTSCFSTMPSYNLRLVRCWSPSGGVTQKLDHSVLLSLAVAAGSVAKVTRTSGLAPLMAGSLSNATESVTNAKAVARH